MIKIIEKSKCCGCSACTVVCPKECVKLVPDEEGFLYPIVDEEKCINCNRCDKVCPVLNIPRGNDNNDKKTVVAQTKNEVLLRECTSGGVVTTLAYYLCERGWYVCAVNYDERFNVVHEITKEKDKIILFSGSKYVQSDLKNKFIEIKKLLDDGQAVMFCGTPCQVVGLKNYLDKDYKMLLAVDLACHGVPSPMLWKKYVEYIEKKRGILDYVSFRSKHFGYHVTVMEERHKGNKTYYGSARTNLMSKIFFSNIADRMSCYDCPFKTINRISDLTVYDCWHASKLIDGLRDNDKGYTNIIIQSRKGQELIDECKSLFDIWETDTRKAIELDGGMVIKSTVKHPKREEFYTYLNLYGIENTVEHFLPISSADFVIEKAKKCLYKLGILRKIKSIRDHICQ